MRFEDICTYLDGIPYIGPENGRILYDFIIRNRPSECLELGFAHGASSCYIAAALDEIGSGHLTCVDLMTSANRKPSIEELVSKTALEKYVTIARENTSYTWFLKKKIEENSKLKFDIFPEEVHLRQRVSDNYFESLAAMRDELRAPFVPEGYKSVWAQYSVLARDEEHRSILQEKLREAGIPTAIYYPRPLHMQTAFSYLGYKEGDFPISEDCTSRIFSLPMHPYLKTEHHERIAQVIGNAAP